MKVRPQEDSRPGTCHSISDELGMRRSLSVPTSVSESGDEVEEVAEAEPSRSGSMASSASKAVLSSFGLV